MARDETKVWQQAPSFKGQNYHVWARKMKTIMIANDLWDLVISGFTNTTNPTQLSSLSNNQKTRLRETRRKDSKPTTMIEVALIKALFLRIIATSYSKEAWDILKTTFKGTDQVYVVKLQMLRRDFESLLMKENEFVLEFSARVSTLIN